MQICRVIVVVACNVCECYLQIISTNKTDATYLTEILLKMALNTKTLTLILQKCIYIYTPTVIITKMIMTAG